jgi:hypothetical protein
MKSTRLLVCCGAKKMDTRVKSAYDASDAA